ncbi:MAG TPA: hypothetical protein VN721_13960 [Flavipsychrobacter sp.]|nr:hypothetical protein [Flavipsychrobacter sp.]
MRKVSSIICVLLFAITSCKKIDQHPYNYTFQNNTNQSINIDVYQTSGDYNNNTNVFLHAVVQPYGTFMTPQLVNGASYYVDWYNNDYTVTNWVNNPYSSFLSSVVINPTLQNNMMRLSAPLDYVRLLCINGNQYKTRWKAVGGHEDVDGTNIPWDQLTPDQQYIQMEFRKDFSTNYYYIVDGQYWNSGNLIYETESGGINGGNTSGNVTIKVGYNDRFVGNIAYPLTAPAGTPGAKPTDTITVSLQDVGVFQMVRMTNN